MTGQMTPAQAVQQDNRDSTGRYAEKNQQDPGSMVVAEPGEFCTRCSTPIIDDDPSWAGLCMECEWTTKTSKHRITLHR